ncbi:MAG: tRNA pseudouridine(55) synthase TruB, partial [Gammaproteobacteria bacterium]
MRASLDSTAQLAVLADLGIEVWRLRGVPEPPETLTPAEGIVSVPAATATRAAGAASAMSAGPASGAVPG